MSDILPDLGTSTPAGGVDTEHLPSLLQSPATVQPAPAPNFGASVDAWNKLAGQAQDIGNRYLQQKATEAGSAAVTRDAQGNIQAKDPHFPITPADEAYNQAESVALLSQKQIDAYSTISALKQQYPNDPDGFRTALDQASGKLLDGVPGPFMGAVREQLDREGASAYNDVLTEYRSNTVKAAAENTDALFKINSAKLQPYISAGTWNSDPDAQSLIHQNLAMLDAKMNNPAFPTYTKAQHDLDANEFLTGIQAQAVVAQVPQIWKDAGGDREVAEQKATGLINSLPLSFADKTSYLSKVLTEIRDQSTLDRQTRAQNQLQIRDSLDDAGAVGMSGAPGGWRSRLSEGQIWANYPAPQAAQIIEGLDYKDGVGQISNEVPLASPADMNNLRTKYSADGAPATPKMPIDQAIFGQELTFGKNAKPSADGSSIGPMQIRPSTFVEYAKRGESIDNPADNLAVGKRIVADYNQRFNGDPARVAVAYFSGPDNVSAVGSPNPYVHNYQDANGKTVGSYVSDILGRMGVSGSTSDQAMAYRLSKAFDTASKQRDSDIAADPVDHVLSNAPDVAQQIGSQDPATRANGFRTLLGWQAHIGVSPGDLAVFTKDQASALTNALQYSPPDQAVAALRAATAGMSPQMAQIAGSQIAKNNRAFAMATTVAPSNPLLAANIIRGEQYLAQNPDVRPEDKQSSAAFDSTTGGSDSSWISSGTGGLFQFAPDGRANAMAATSALYAKSMIGQPATKAGGKQNFDATRYQSAMQQALGDTPITVRNQIIMPPAPGYDASKTEDMMRGLTAEQIAQYGNGRPVLANGRPVAASDIAQHGVLTWTGTPGLYRVRFPGQGHIGVSGNRDGSRTFMLNLGGLATGAPPPTPQATTTIRSPWVQ